MKTETRYICEKCGWRYNTEEECQKCEAYHQDASSLVSQRFDHKFAESAKYPGSVILQMANGHKMEYRFYKPIVEKPDTIPVVPTEPTTDDGNNG